MADLFYVMNVKFMIDIYILDELRGWLTSNQIESYRQLTMRFIRQTKTYGSRLPALVCSMLHSKQGTIVKRTQFIESELFHVAVVKSNIYSGKRDRGLTRRWAD